MAVRYPLVIDTTDNNKIKELPLNDSLNLSTNSIVNAVNITASGTLTVANLVVDSNSVSINGNPIATVAVTNSYTDLSNKPSLFDGQYSSLTGRPTIVSTTEDLADVSSTQATNGQALIYNSTTGVYEPGSVADAALDLTSQSISELADVAVISISTNQVLKWTGATFANSNVAFSELTGTPTTLAGYGITDAQVAGALTDGDIKGSVFADDSTLLVDGVNGRIPYSVIDGRPTVVTDLTNDAGYVTNAQLTSGALTINVTNQGLHDGDITGSVYGDNSTKIVDGVNNTLHGTLYGAHVGTLDGDVEGSVFGDDSTLLVDGNNNKIVGPVLSSDLRSTSPNVRIGLDAGLTNQGTYSIAIGERAGNLNQSADGIAIGYAAGRDDQQTDGIAIGQNAGQVNQGASSVAIGTMVGKTNQHANTIMLSATGATFNSTQANALFVKPIRSASGTTTLMYDATTGEVTHTATPAQQTMIGSVQQISGPGAIDVTSYITEITTTGTNDAYTLADGVAGQIKIIVMVVDGGDAIITPTTLATGTNITMADVNDNITLLYGANGWLNTANQGSIIA